MAKQESKEFEEFKEREPGGRQPWSVASLARPW
jgi:hypothetical protein